MKQITRSPFADLRVEEILSQLVTMASQPEKWTIKSNSHVQRKNSL